MHMTIILRPADDPAKIKDKVLSGGAKENR
jgi:hypothetical protein